MIQFELSGGLLFVPVEIRHGRQNRRLRFILDCGSAGSAVDINLIRPDFSRNARPVEIRGAGGRQPAVIQEVDFLGIGPVSLTKFSLEFADLEDFFGAQGIIGNDLLERFQAVIDYRAQTLTLRTPLSEPSL